MVAETTAPQLEGELKTETPLRRSEDLQLDLKAARTSPRLRCWTASRTPPSGRHSNGHGKVQGARRCPAPRPSGAVFAILPGLS